MDNQKLGIFITELRKEKGLTQAQLAQKLNVTDKAVSKCFCIRPCALPIVISLEVYFVKLSLSEKSRNLFLFN